MSLWLSKSVAYDVASLQTSKRSSSYEDQPKVQTTTKVHSPCKDQLAKKVDDDKLGFVDA